MAFKLKKEHLLILVMFTIVTIAICFAFINWNITLKNKYAVEEFMDKINITDVKQIGLFTESQGMIEFDAMIADSPEKRMKGLMHYESLPQDQGMLFSFNGPSEARFWMKNVKIPLDIIFISEDLRIMQIHKNAQPCKSDPCKIYPSGKNPVWYAFEINGGLSKKYGIKEGMKVVFNP